MGTIALWMQVSLDGYVEGPRGEFDWPTVEAELHSYFNDELRQAATFLYGRRVYEMMASFWPTVEDGPGASGRHVDYARIWKPMPKLVFSRTLDHADWNARVGGDPAAEVAALRQADGRHVLFGGGEIAHAFQADDLIDEYHLFVHPVVLGGGKPLFAPGRDRAALRLVESRVFDPGVVHLHYTA
jgi:dihydrofolate reductase